jgi:O-antigen ligase
MSQPENKAPHILSASANLLGICFLLLTSLKFFGKANETILDEITFIAIVLYMSSCLLSFLSIRKPNGGKLEKIADLIFMAGLAVLFITATLFTFNIIK